MRHFLFAFALLFSTGLFAQFPFEHRYDKQAAAERKKNRIRAAYFTEQKFDTLTGREIPRERIDTVMYELYDAGGRLTVKLDLTHPLPLPRSYYWYDADGNLTQITFSDLEGTTGYEVRFTYNNANLLTKQEAFRINGQTRSIEESVEYRYDESNRLAKSFAFLSGGPGDLFVHSATAYRYADNYVIATCISAATYDTLQLDTTFTTKNGTRKVTRVFRPKDDPFREYLARPQFRNSDTIRTGKQTAIITTSSASNYEGTAILQTDSSATVTDPSGDLLEYTYRSSFAYVHHVYSPAKKNNARWYDVYTASGKRSARITITQQQSQ